MQTTIEKPKEQTIDRLKTSLVAFWKLEEDLAEAQRQMEEAQASLNHVTQNYSAIKMECLGLWKSLDYGPHGIVTLPGGQRAVISFDRIELSCLKVVE